MMTAIVKRSWLGLLVVGACAARPPVPANPSTATLVQLSEHRAKMIAWLHDYVEAGRYPQTPDGMPISEFQDVRGVRCPMAELIHRSGHDDLVKAVVRDDNMVRLADVHDGPLHDWMVDSGLTAAEISLVQGALTLEQMRSIQDHHQLAVARAAGEVRGRLETAETVLRADTTHSIADAIAHLPGGKMVAIRPVTGRVVPAGRIAAAR